MEDYDKDLAISLSYMVLTGKSTVEELAKFYDPIILEYNPFLELKIMDGDIYDILTEYFEEREEYEKCRELQGIKKVLSLVDPSDILT